MFPCKSESVNNRTLLARFFSSACIAKETKQNSATEAIAVDLPHLTGKAQLEDNAAIFIACLQLPQILETAQEGASTDRFRNRSSACAFQAGTVPG